MQGAATGSFEIVDAYLSGVEARCWAAPFWEGSYLDRALKKRTNYFADGIEGNLPARIILRARFKDRKSCHVVKLLNCQTDGFVHCSRQGGAKEIMDLASEVLRTLHKLPARQV